MQVLGKIFFSLHRAETGLAGEKEDELFLPQNVRIPAAGAPSNVKQQCAAEAIRRGKLSLVASLFGMDVQVHIFLHYLVDFKHCLNFCQS